MWTYNWPCVFDGEGVKCVAILNNANCGGEIESLPKYWGNYSLICYSYKATSNNTAFPNQARNEIVIKLNSIDKYNKLNLVNITQIKIVDKMGVTKKVITNSSNLKQILINVSELKNDIYYIIVSDKLQNAKIPIIIKR